MSKAENISAGKGACTVAAACNFEAVRLGSVGCRTAIRLSQFKHSEALIHKTNLSLSVNPSSFVHTFRIVVLPQRFTCFLPERCRVSEERRWLIAVDVQVLYDELNQYTDAGASVGDPVVTFEGAAVLAPRGRFDIELYLSFLKLTGQVITFSSLHSLFPVRCIVQKYERLFLIAVSGIVTARPGPG